MEGKDNKNVSNKKIGINFIANVISFLVQVVISFFMTPLLINSLGKEVYSFYPLANNIVTYMTLVTTALNTMAARFITISLVQKRIEDSKKYFSSIITVNFIISFILMIPIVFFIIFINHILNVPINSLASIQILFSLVFSSAIVNIISSIFGIATFAKNRIDLRSIREILASVIKLVLYIIFFKIYSKGIEYIGITVLIVALFNLLVQFIYTKRLLPELELTFKYSNVSYTKELLAASFWNIISSLGGILLVGLSLILSNILFNETAAGSYSIVQTIPNLLNSLISILCGIFFPVLMYRYASSGKEVALIESVKDQKIVSSIGCSVAFIFLAMSSFFYKLWVPSENNVDLFILTVPVIIQCVATACFYNISQLSIVLNKIKIPAIVEVFLGVINVLLALLFCKVFQFGVICLPILSLSLHFIWLAVFYPLYLYFSVKINPISLYISALRSIVIGVACFFLTYMILKNIVISSWIQFVIFACLFGGITLMCEFIGNFGFKKIFEFVIIIMKKVRFWKSDN